MRVPAIVFLLAATCSVALSAAAPAVTRAYADDKGRVHLVTADGRDRLIPKEKDQEGAEKIQVAADGKTVGWLVESSACCVSYPVPLELVLWRNGRILRRVHPGMAVWSWAFLENGNKVAFRMSPLHGGWSGECVLLDTSSGKTLDSWDHPVDANGNDTEGDSEEPGWVSQIQ